MKIYKIKDMHKGWFIGDFEPSVLKTKKCEVAIKFHPAGEKWDIHYHKEVCEYNYLIQGEMNMCGNDLVAGDIFIVNPYEIANPHFYTDCTIVTVKVPSKIGDKFIIPREQYSDLIKIAHRGNYLGRDEKLENTEEYIQKALDSDYHCEIDVWFENGEYYLGHDKPEQKTSLKFISMDKIICHAKNLETLIQLSNEKNIHYFIHDKDVATITSGGWLWVYPEIYLNGKLFAFCGDNLL